MLFLIGLLLFEEFVIDRAEIVGQKSRVLWTLTKFFKIRGFKEAKKLLRFANPLDEV